MDKNTIIGIVLIFAILIGFSILNQPSQEEIEAAKAVQDSIAQVEAQQQQEAEAQLNLMEQEQESATVDSTVTSTQTDDRFGLFAPASVGEEEFITMENNLMKVTFSTKGGRVYSVELKNYNDYLGNPLVLFNGPDNLFGVNFFSQNRGIQTDELYFTPSTSQKQIVVNGPEVRKGKEGNEEYNEENGEETQTLAMRLQVADGKYLEFLYTLKYNSYMMDFDLNTVGMNDVISGNSTTLNFNWAHEAPRLEKKSKYGEDRYTSVYYKYYEDEVDKLSASRNSEESLTTSVRWISFKQLFFNSTIIADQSFPEANVEYEYTEESDSTVGKFYADIAIPYANDANQTFGMQLYFGPNHYNTLKQYNIELDQLINLGYSILRYVNKWLVIPVFNFLRNYINNFGIIILLLTLFIKMLLLPFTYKSYISQAKMRVLKPEMDEINAKYGKEKQMEKQQAIMALYKKVGVNPMGGCLPMLLQMPILFAMFFFFPGAIELRHQSFLWASDLSSYDSILNLPFSIPAYGDHVSLFCLLMTVTTIISTKLNSQATSGQTMPGMQSMMYLMPVMFLFILNNYPAGLSYYYFLANLITIGQMFVFRKVIDEDKLRVQLYAPKKKQPGKKSNFQKRLEQMAKERGVQLPKK